MSNNDETTPSAPRKRQEVELGRGVVIFPPERIREERKAETKPEEAAKRIEQKRAEVFKPVTAVPVASGTPGILLIIVGLLAVIAIVLSLLAMSSVASMKNQIGLIAANLNGFSQSQLQLNTQLNSSQTIETSVPLSNAIAPFSLSVPPQQIEGTGTINMMTTSGYPVSLPWNGTITVFGTVNVNTSQLSNGDNISISYTIPGTVPEVISVSASSIFNGYLENLTSELEQLSR